MSDPQGYEICRRHAPTTWLSRGEIAIVCDVINGGLLWIPDESQSLYVRSIALEISDAVQYAGAGLGSYAHKHRREGEPLVDESALVDKLRAASFADLAALADFVERFWADDTETERAIHPETV